MRDALVFTRTKHRADRLTKYLAGAQGQRRADPRQPLAGAADAGARRIQEGPLPGAGRDRHRGARHRRHRARPRHQLRRADAARGLHPPRRAHRARRADGLRVHAGVVGRRRRPAGDREGDRAAPAARHGARLRLQSAPPSGSRCRTRSASPRSARARPKSAPARAPTRSAARCTPPADRRRDTAAADRRRGLAAVAGTALPVPADPVAMGVPAATAVPAAAASHRGPRRPGRADH